MTFFESSARSILLFERDLFGKPVPTFPDHALEPFFDAFSRREPVPTPGSGPRACFARNALLSSPSGTGSHASRRPGHVRDPLVPRIHRRASRHRCRDRPAPAESDHRKDAGGTFLAISLGISWRARNSGAGTPMRFQAAVAALAQAWEWERAWGSAPQRPKPENCPARSGA